MDITTFRTEGLGDSTYLLTLDDVGVLVDPQRDYDRFLDRLDGKPLAFVLETHLHNDYVSGGKAAASKTGADLVLPAAAGAAFAFRPAFHLEDIDAGTFQIRPVHTPGHTPEHTSFVIVVDGEPRAVFSGGSLLVEAAGRTDLLGEDRARQLARLQYQSVHRLAALPDEVQLFPTHGEGSFCAASGAGRHTSTIGVEKAESPVFRYPDADSFVEGQLAGLQPYPTYYAHMGPINLFGPPPISSGRPVRLDVDQMASIVDADTAAIIDIRPRRRFAEGHIPGSLCVELADNFGTWVGWLVDFTQEIVLVAHPDQDIDEAWIQLARIGMDRLAGVFDAMGDWVASGRPVARYQSLGQVRFRSLLDDPEAQLLDVRAPDEYDGGQYPGSVHRYLPHLLRDGIPEELDPEHPVLVACASGHRATAAAGILERAGYQPVVLAEGGVSDLLIPATAR